MMNLLQLNRINASGQISQFGYLSTFFILLLIICSSCQKEIALEKELYSVDDKIEITEYLLDQGFHQDSIHFRADMVFTSTSAGYLIEDLLLTIRGEFIPDFPEDPDADDMPADLRQRGTADRINAVAYNSVNSILYFIRPSVQNDCGNGWVNAIGTAAQRWNDLTDCRVIFLETNSQSSADIIIGSDEDNILPAGLSNFPNGVAIGANGSLNGNPGSFIAISDAIDGYTRKRRQVMFAFGITVGFEVANQNTIGILLHGTPNNPNESVMNVGWSASSNSFTDGDKRMARLFYPRGFYRPTNFSASPLGSGLVRLSYRNYDQINFPYHWVRFAKYSASGNILAVTYVESRTNSAGIHTHYWGGQGSGTFRYAVRGCNYRRDAWSSRSNQVTIPVN